MKISKMAISIAMLTGMFAQTTIAAGDGNSAGTVVVLGGVSASSCTVDPTDQYKVVRLPVITTGAFKTTDRAGATKFSIKLIDCPMDANVGLYFNAGITTELDKGWMKAYRYKKGDPSETGMSNTSMDELFDNDGLSAGTKASFDEVVKKIKSGTNTESQSKLFFELMSSDFTPIVIGDASQRSTDDSDRMGGVVADADGSLTVNGAVQYAVKNVADTPDAGYYYSYTTFNVEYN